MPSTVESASPAPRPAKTSASPPAVWARTEVRFPVEQGVDPNREAVIMDIVANVLIGVVAVLHLYFMVLEMFLWERPPGRKLSGFDAELARASAPLAANQGLYNGFLAAGLVWGLTAADPTGFGVRVFFLSCVVIAGVYGAATANRRILFAQAVPGCGNGSPGSGPPPAGIGARAMSPGGSRDQARQRATGRRGSGPARRYPEPPDLSG